MINKLVPIHIFRVYYLILDSGLSVKVKNNQYNNQMFGQQIFIAGKYLQS